MTKFHPFTHSLLSASPFWRSLVAGAALFAASTVWATQPGAAGEKSSIEATYQKDRAACMTRESEEARSNCLREAGAVRAEALRGAQSGGESKEALARNALERCKRHPPEQQAICERMVRGEGSATGSVEGGGVIRELTIMEPVPAAATPDVPPGAQVLPPAGAPQPAR